MEVWQPIVVAKEKPCAPASAKIKQVLKSVHGRTHLALGLTGIGY